MKRTESFYHADWLRIAEKDLKRAERQLKDNDLELAGFCLQQALEKFLKAFLLSQGWQLKKIHDLDILLASAVDFDPSLIKYREMCQKLTAFYFIERYPFVVETEVTTEDVSQLLREAKELIVKLRNLKTEK